MRTKFAVLTLAIASARFIDPAYAGRPLQTEDAGVLDLRGCEIEGAHSRFSVAETRAYDTDFGFSCGVGFRSQLGLGRTWGRADSASSSGAGVGGKTWLWRATGDEGTAVTLAYGLSSARKEGGWETSNHSLNVVTSIPVSAGQVHLNLGNTKDHIEKLSSTAWNIAYESNGYDFNGINLAPMGEIFGDDREAPWWNLALRATVIPDTLFVDFSYGRQITTGTPKWVTAGFKVAF